MTAGKDYPPRLIGCEVEGDRLLLELSDGKRVAVEISQERLASLLERPLDELATSNVEVYVPVRTMTEHEWQSVRALLTTPQFSENERITGFLAMTAQELARLPQRVYGGTNLGKTLYLSLPMNFTQHDDGRYYALLNDRDQFWKVWVDIEAGKVELEEGEASGHFILKD